MRKCKCFIDENVGIGGGGMLRGGDRRLYDGARRCQGVGMAWGPAMKWEDGDG